MTTAVAAATRNAPESDSRKTQGAVSRAIHVLSTEDQPLQVVTHCDRACRNLENMKKISVSRLSCFRSISIADDGVSVSPGN
jgi:hypothetical protein